MRLFAEIVRSLGSKLLVGLLLTCCVSVVSAQNYNSPFSSGGMQYSSGISSSVFDGNRAKQQSPGRYSGLSGGRTTFDNGYQLSGGVPKSLIDNPFFAEQYDDGSKYGDQFRAPVNGHGGKPDPGHQLPLGEPIVPLMLMLVGYAVWKRRQSRRETE